MAKVFLSFFNGNDDMKNLPLFYEGFINGLKKAGNEVLYYAHRYFNSTSFPYDNMIVDQIKNFSPDLIILFNNAFFDYDFSKDFDCPIIVYGVDTVRYFSNKEILKNNTKYKFITSGTNDIKSIKDAFNVPEERVCLIPFFTSIKAEKKDFKQNISFIGTFFTYPDFVKRFSETSPSAEEIETFHKIVNSVKNNPFITKGEIIASLGIVSKKILDILNIDNFIGYITAIDRIKTLSAVADLGLDLYGTSGWINELSYYPEITLAYRSQKVYTIQHNQDIYNSSKIGISIAHAQATSAFPWRVTDIMASNACLVSDYHSDFNLYFPNVKIPTFSSPAEARDVCKDLLNNENKRLDIVAASQEAIEGKFRFENVLKVLEEFSGIVLHSDIAGKSSTISTLSEILPKVVDAAFIKYLLYVYLCKKTPLSHLFKDKKIMKWKSKILERFK